MKRKIKFERFFDKVILHGDTPETKRWIKLCSFLIIVAPFMLLIFTPKVKSIEMYLFYYPYCMSLMFYFWFVDQLKYQKFEEIYYRDSNKTPIENEKEYYKELLQTEVGKFTPEEKVRFEKYLYDKKNDFRKEDIKNDGIYLMYSFSLSSFLSAINLTHNSHAMLLCIIIFAITFIVGTLKISYKGTKVQRCLDIRNRIDDVIDKLG